jgi:hypothetical protein
MQVGRERPRQGRAGGEEGASSGGDAPAPLATDRGIDSGTDEDAGGKERRA